MGTYGSAHILPVTSVTRLYYGNYDIKTGVAVRRDEAVVLVQEMLSVELLFTQDPQVVFRIRRKMTSINERKFVCPFFVGCLR